MVADHSPPFLEKTMESMLAFILVFVAGFFAGGTTQLRCDATLLNDLLQVAKAQRVTIEKQDELVTLLEAKIGQLRGRMRG